MFKTFWDILVLLATIYVAVVVPYNACFTDPVDTVPEHCLQFPTNSSSSGLTSADEAEWAEQAGVSENGNGSSIFGSHVLNGSDYNPSLMSLDDEDQMKRSIVVDVIVETVFIIGKETLLSRESNQFYFSCNNSLVVRFSNYRDLQI